MNIDLFCSPTNDSELSSRQNFLEDLHELFKHLRTEEESNSESKRIPALHPLQFLESVRLVNGCTDEIETVFAS